MIQSLIDSLKQLAIRLIHLRDTIPPTPVVPIQTSKIPAWALAIQHQEGGMPYNRNMRNNNPGNIKASNYTLTFKGICGRDQSFLKFDTYENGFNALCTFLTDAANGRLIPYGSSCTILEFTQTYAQPPSNAYANGVARELGVPVSTPIKALL